MYIEIIESQKNANAPGKWYKKTSLSGKEHRT